MDFIHCSILDTSKWMSKFRSTTYSQALEDYQSLFASEYQALLAQKSAKLITQHIITIVKEDCQNLKKVQRSLRLMDIRSVIAIYLSPMLLNTGDARCKELCNTLCSAWEEEWPKDCYSIADSRTIQSGFCRKILGINLENLPEKWHRKKDNIL